MAKGAARVRRELGDGIEVDDDPGRAASASTAAA
jgi:hypothetical protein